MPDQAEVMTDLSVVQYAYSFWKAASTQDINAVAGMDSVALKLVVVHLIDAVNANGSDTCAR